MTDHNGYITFSSTYRVRGAQSRAPGNRDGDPRTGDSFALTMTEIRISGLLPRHKIRIGRPALVVMKAWIEGMN